MNRIEESIQIMKEIYGLGIRSDYPPLKELSKRLSDYIKTGEPWSGQIKFSEYNRVAGIILPRKSTQEISVVLRKIN